MKKVFKIVVPLVLSLLIIASIGWYLFVYDRDFTRDMLLQQARHHDTQGNTELASWFYDRAYEHTGQDQNVAIELANQYKADGNYTKAEYTLTNAIADGATVELYIALCKTYVEQDKLLDAVAMLDSIPNPLIRGELDVLRPEAPSAEQEPGFYTQYIRVNLLAESGTLYCTTNGEYPSVADEPYAEPFTLPAGETVVTAITVAENGLVSPLTVLNYTVGGVIEPVNFTDPAMEKAMRELLGADENDVIYTNALWDVQEFTVPAEAESFGDLAYLPYLNRLTVEDHTFDSLSCLESLTSLEEVSFTGCKFPDHDLTILAALPALQKLTLADCGLSTVADLATAQNLTYLDLSNNAIRNLEPLSAMVTLKELHLQHNAVTNLAHLSNLVNLQTLDVSYNSLTSVAPLATCSGLTWLNVSNNAITDLAGLDSLSGLATLYVQSNQLENVSLLGSCTTLVELNISSNKITDISALAALTALETFDFSYNQVEVLPAWPNGSALYSINGSYNMLTSVSSLQNMEDLAYVYMDYNQLTSVDALAGCHHLVMVNVYGNEIPDVSALTSQSIIVNYDPTT